MPFLGRSRQKLRTSERLGEAGGRFVLTTVCHASLRPIWVIGGGNFMWVFSSTQFVPGVGTTRSYQIQRLAPTSFEFDDKTSLFKNKVPKSYHLIFRQMSVK